MKAATIVPNANDGEPEKSLVCAPAQFVHVPSGTSQWELFRAGMATIVSVPKERVDVVIESEQAGRAKVREGRK